MMSGSQPQTTRLRSFAPVAPTMRIAPPTERVAFATLAKAAAPVDAPKCLNCEELLAGKFCHACGQSSKTPARFSVGAVLHELPHAILHLEHALPHTVFALLRRPGHTIRAYLEGKRVKMYSPFTLLFMVAGLLGLAMVTFKLNRAIPSLQIQSTNNDLTLKTSHAVLKYQAWVRLAMVPIVATGPAIVLKARTGMRYGEHLVAAAMVTAGSVLVSLITIPLHLLVARYYPQGLIPVCSVFEALTTLYVVWAYAQLQDDGKRQDSVRRWLRSVASLLMTAVIWVGAIIVVCVVAILGGTLAVVVGKKLHLI